MTTLTILPNGLQEPPGTVLTLIRIDRSFGQTAQPLATRFEQQRRSSY